MRRSWVEIDLSVLAENIQTLQSALPAKGPELIMVVKADAYGHGMVEVAKKAYELGVTWFAVAYEDSALALRKQLKGGKILVLGVTEPTRVPELLGKNIIPIVADLDHAQALSAAAVRAGRLLPVHVKIDTGMGRLGIQWQDAAEQLEDVFRLKGLDICGMCSHFAKVEPLKPACAQEQAARFMEITTLAEQLCGHRLFKHISSSRAILYRPEWDFDGIRPGIVLYGYGAQDADMRCNTSPLLQWKGQVMQVKSVPANYRVGYYGTFKTFRPTDIGVLACGYADGYLRALSNHGNVLIHGRRCPVIGRVSMNWMAVDLGPESGVRRGDEAVFIGTQDKESIWANELASICRTIPYEILTCIDARIERVYRNE
ncbi:MAG: alanine racemase [Spartobacteria bacterium]|nr:alanine racemase [Spartobacteria bacterium]